MTDRKAIEKQLEEALGTESSAIALSNRLFSPDGLFNQLASTEKERGALVQSSLFKQAQEQLAKLRRAEAAMFSRAVEQAQATLPDGAYQVRVEPAVNA
jgi:hypothetical protein